MLFVRWVPIFWKNLQPTLQDGRVVFYPDDGGSQFVRNIGTYTKLYGITIHKNIDNKCLDNLKYLIKVRVFDTI
jgi:hypothetical protein